MILASEINFHPVHQASRECPNPRVVDLDLPKESGVYLWKTNIGNHEVVFPARMRKVYGGHEGLSPDFDHWTGYTYIIPNINLSWAENNGYFEEPKFKDNSCEKELKIIGKPLHNCPFCKSEPSIEYDWRSNIPNGSASFKVKCCKWVSSPHFNTLDKLLESWNGMIAES